MSADPQLGFLGEIASAKLSATYASGADPDMNSTRHLLLQKTWSSIKYRFAFLEMRALHEAHTKLDGSGLGDGGGITS
jgi:hypothetical protein